MVLTPAGEMLLARVEGMMREFARVKSHVAALQNLQAGTVDIYCFQAAIESFVAPALHQFHMRYPNVLFNVTVSSADKTIEALTNGTAEIGLSSIRRFETQSHAPKSSTIRSVRRWLQLTRLRDAKPYRCRSSPNSPSF